METYKTLRQIIDGTLSGALSEEECYRQLVRHVAHKLEATRVSIWYFHDNEKAIAKVYYEAPTQGYTYGQSIEKQQCMDFFTLLSAGANISIPDVHSYYLLKSINLTSVMSPDLRSLFVVPIRYRSKSIGFISSEHIDQKELKYSEISYLETIVSMVTHLLYNIRHSNPL